MKNPTSNLWRGATLLAVLCVIATGARAGQGTAGSQVASPPGAFEEWWNGKYATGDWFGARDALKDRGIKLGGSYKLAYFGVVGSQNGSGGFYGQDIVFNANADFAKLLGWDGIDGLEGFIEGRWRENRPNVGNPNELVDASSMFNPSPWWSGVGWRMVQFGAKYTSPEMFGVDEFLTLKGGWLRPQREFIDQPLSKLFLNNAINSSKGVGGNIPFSSSFSTWGGTAQVKAADWQYTKMGLFMAYPDGTSFDNNGLMFQGYAPDTSLNRLMFMGETGVTPEIGSSKLPGRYAFGAYVYGQDEEEGGNQYGFYWQADQMLFREPGALVPSAGTTDGKSLASPVNVDAKPKLSTQGLRIFNLFTAAPSFNNNYPFYFQSGLVYEGLIPTRDQDLLMAAVGLASYANKEDATNTLVFETGYRFQVNGWAFLQPYFQYLSRPDGTPDVANAAILGFLAGIDF